MRSRKKTMNANILIPTGSARLRVEAAPEAAKGSVRPSDLQQFLARGGRPSREAGDGARIRQCEHDKEYRANSGSGAARRNVRRTAQRFYCCLRRQNNLEAVLRKMGKFKFGLIVRASDRTLAILPRFRQTCTLTAMARKRPSATPFQHSASGQFC